MKRATWAIGKVLFLNRSRILSLTNKETVWGRHSVSRFLCICIYSFSEE